MKVLKKVFRLEIVLEGSAFGEDSDRDTEVARILREAADTALLYGVGWSSRLRDINGNTVGQFTVSEEEVKV